MIGTYPEEDLVKLCFILNVMLLDNNFALYTHRIVSNLNLILSICSFQTVVQLVQKLKTFLDFKHEPHEENDANVFQDRHTSIIHAKSLHVLLKLNRFLDIEKNLQPIRFLQRYLTLLYIESIQDEISSNDETNSTPMYIDTGSTNDIDWNAQPVNGLHLVCQFLQVEPTFSAGLNKEHGLLWKFTLCIHYALSSFAYVKRNKVIQCFNRRKVDVC